MADDSEELEHPEDAQEDATDAWFKSTMATMQGWRLQSFRQRNNGITLRAEEVNKLTPWAFQFVCLGSFVWMTFVAIPYYYRDKPLWFFFTEMLVVFAFIHVTIDWLFICFTTSIYEPEETDDVKKKMSGSQDNEHTDNDNKESTRDDKQMQRKCGDEDNEKTIPSDKNNVKSDDSESSGSTQKGSRIMIATEVIDNKVVRKSVPYWSWTQCVVCQRKRPPRCHHCTLCNVCVLKRDHHCYFTRNCVGMYNQRYFIYFLFWCIIFTNLGCYHLLPYIINIALSEYSYIDYVFPLNVVRSLLGYFPFIYCHLVIIMWGGLFLTFLSAIMFGGAFYLVLTGRTKFEFDSAMKIVDTRSIPGRIRAVMGENWAIGLLIPGGASFAFVTSRIPAVFSPSQPVDDPVEWKYTSVKN